MPVHSRKTSKPSGDPPPPAQRNVAPTEAERLEEIKQAYVDGIIDVPTLERDALFVLEGGYFAGKYSTWVQRERIREIGGDEGEQARTS